MKDEIILNNLGLIYKVMKDLHCNLSNENEFEDYYYAGLLGLIKASKTYDKAKGKSGYLYNAIKLNIYQEFTNRTRKKRHSDLKDVSINQEQSCLKLEDYLQSNINIEYEVLNKLYVEDILSKLKERQYKKFLIEYYGINTPQLNSKEIAQKYGVSQSFVNQSIRRAIKIIKKEVLNDKKVKKNKIKIKNEA